MSFKLVVRIMYECELPRNKQLVLQGMAENADDWGRGSRPSVDLIAWKANYKPRNVINIMRELADDGIIELVEPARQHRAAEYDIYLDKAPQKMPFEKWRKLHGRHAGRQAGRRSRGATPAPLADSPLDTPGVQNQNPGVQSRDSRGALASAPEPVNRSHEPTKELSVEKGPLDPSQPGGKRDLDHDERRVKIFMDGAPDQLVDPLRGIMQRAASKNQGGKITPGRQWRGFVSQVIEASEAGASEEALRYALEETDRQEKWDMNYFKAVLRNNPEGDPRRKGPLKMGVERNGAPERGGNDGADKRGGGKYADLYSW